MNFTHSVYWKSDRGGRRSRANKSSQQDANNAAPAVPVNLQTAHLDPERRGGRGDDEGLKASSVKHQKTLPFLQPGDENPTRKWLVFTKRGPAGTHERTHNHTASVTLVQPVCLCPLPWPATSPTESPFLPLPLTHRHASQWRSDPCQTEPRCGHESAATHPEEQQSGKREEERIFFIDSKKTHTR